MLGLTLAILYHSLLGILLAALVWGVGGGWLLVLRRARPPLDRAAAVYAYPVGLLVVLGACTLFLLAHWLGLISLALVVLPLATAARRRALVAPLARLAAASVVWATPAVLGLGVTLGFFLHGPTGRVDSNAFGDVVWYAAKLASVRQSLVPLRDLSAAGLDLWHAEIGPSLVGATASYLPGFDPLLFHTSLLPAFLGASLCVGLALAGSPPEAPRIRLALLALGMTAYASWFAESPPVTLALPLAFAIPGLVQGRLPRRWFGTLLAVVALDLVLTKGLALVPLAILAAFALRRYRLSAAQRWSVALVAPLAAVALLAASLANSWWVLEGAGLRFQPLTVYHGLRSQLDTRSTIELAPALQLAGYVLLAVILLRRRAWALLAAFAVSVLWSWTILPYTIDIGLGLVVLLSALLLRRAPTTGFDGLLLAAAAAALALGTWFRDFAGIRAALVECTCLAALVLSSLATSAPALRRPAVFHLRLYAVAGALALLALSGHALAAGAGLLAGLAVFAVARIPLRAASLAAGALLALGTAVAVTGAGGLELGHYDRTILTRDHYGVWQRVARRVPPDGLVFTDETGPSEDASAGLNYYPALSGRQIYLAGWYQSRLRHDRAERERRLRLNQLVLDGNRSPESAVGRGRYASFYAVVDRAGPHPSSFRRLYANGRFALYEIRSRR